MKKNGKRLVDLYGDNGHEPNFGKEGPGGTLLIDDMIMAQVLLMFFVQKMGKPSLAQLGEKVAAAGVTMNPILLQQAVESLQARGLVSYATTRVAETGEQVRAYKPRNILWANLPEVAHVTSNFLAELVATDDAEELLDALNVAESEGKGKAKAKERLKYADYHAYEITFRVLDVLLGGQPESPWLTALVKKGPPAPEKCDLRLPRGADGWPVIPTSNLRGWISGLLRVAYFSDSIGSYFYLPPARIEFDGKIEQVSKSVVDDQKRGVGLNTYEAIVAGATFTVHVSLPVRGFLTPIQVEAALTAFAPCPPRGISNGRSGEYGRCEVIKFRDLGACVDAATALAAVSDQIVSDEAKVHLADLLKRVGDAGLDLRSAKKAT